MVLDYKDMPIEHIVVDGSNIATEGRSLPSLRQLEEAVAELRRDHPDAEITVIVDATFAHRIDPSELPRFELAALRGEYVHPPAGAIGRGDAFLLRVAEKVDGTVLSNDSFQEFHGEHPWLFERGRLLGGTPVPGIGWIFSPRQPVRGPRSRQAVRETVQAKKRVTKAIAVATKEVVEPAGKLPAAGSAGGRSRSRRSDGGPEPVKPPADGSRGGGKPTPLAVNDPLAFISFIAEHPLGEQVEGEVEGYTSHGAVVRVGEMRCYVPLANLGAPPPRSAREVLKRRERGIFVLTALDPQRRGAELALPGIALVSGHPREETVAAEVRLAQPPRTRVYSSAQPGETRPPRKRADGSGSRTAEPAKRTSAVHRPAKKAVPEKAVAPAETGTSAETAAAAASTGRKPAKRRPRAKAPAAEVTATKAAVKKQAPRKQTAPKLVVPPSSAKKAAAAAKPMADKAGAEPVADKAPTAKKTSMAAAKKVAAPRKAPVGKKPAAPVAKPQGSPVATPPGAATTVSRLVRPSPRRPATSRELEGLPEPRQTRVAGDPPVTATLAEDRAEHGLTWLASGRSPGWPGSIWGGDDLDRGPYPTPAAVSSSLRDHRADPGELGPWMLASEGR